MVSVGSVKPLDINFEDALNNYYKLKSKYDSVYQKKVADLRKNKEYSTQQKRDKLAEFKNKCISCKSLGGTIFSQDGNILIAHCGSTHKPCKLNIRLQKGVYDNITNIIQDFNNLIDKNKVKTIQTKYNFLFGFNPESVTVEEFNRLKIELIEEVKKYQIINDKYLSIIDNLLKKKQVKELNYNLDGLIQRFKDLINKFKETEEPPYLKEAIELYTENIVKVTHDICKLKYIENEVENDKDTGIHTLIQKPYTLEQLLVLVPGTENKILEYHL